MTSYKSKIWPVEVLDAIVVENGVAIDLRVSSGGSLQKFTRIIEKLYESDI